MDKQTLSNYGWIVICVLVLAVMIALATPFGTFVKGATENTTQGLFDVHRTALGVAGIAIDEQEFEDANSNGSGGGGGSEPATLTFQEEFDATHTGVTPTTGYTFTYGDYEYAYNKYWTAEDWGSDSSNGWGVRVLDKTKSSYGEILTSAYGQPIKCLSYAFQGCASFTTAPEIPSSVTNITGIFLGCTSLTTAPEIPDGVLSTFYAFFGCTSLTIATEIPSGVMNMNYTFSQCTSLTTAPAIPNGVTSMEGIFSNCTSLKTYIGSIDPDGDFSHYIIPSSVTSMVGTFNGCTLLTTAPEIPSGVTKMGTTFKGCTSLTGTITINANPTSYTNCLKNTQITAVVGATTLKSQILATK